MPDMERIQVGDIGTSFRIRVLDDEQIVDLSTSTEMSIIFLKPDNTLVVQVASFFTDGKDGYMQYISVAGDIDQTGRWRYQGYVKFGLSSWHTNYISFLVNDNLEDK